MLLIVFFFSKNIQIWKFMKMRLLGSELSHADRQTDVTKLTVTFRKSTNARKNATRRYVCSACECTDSRMGDVMHRVVKVSGVVWALVV